MESQHRHHGEAAQCQRDHPGDLALPDLEGPGLVKDGGRLADDRRWLHGREVHGWAAMPASILNI
jgi:hypothetical protein